MKSTGQQIKSYLLWERTTKRIFFILQISASPSLSVKIKQTKSNLKETKKSKFSYLSKKDINFSINTLLKISQTESIRSLSLDQDISQSIKILNLNPIFKYKMIKVCVRIQS